MKQSIILTIVLSVFITGCAFGPLVSHETARTVGDGNHELAGGLGRAGYVFKWNYGLADNLDVGVHYESMGLGIRAKYAFLNNESGWSFATALGTGISIGGTYNNLDLMGSYKVSAWEPYATLRLVQAKSQDTTLEGEGILGITSFKGQTFNYSHHILGTRYWFNERWMISVEVSSLSLISDPLYGAALGYRF